MPYTLDLIGAIWHVTFHGVVTGADLMRLADDAASIEKALTSMPNRLIDLRPATRLKLDLADIRKLARRRRARRYPNPFKSAIVVTKRRHVALARLFQLLTRRSKITVEIFSNKPTALAWLLPPEE
jgi:hypothetical protein